MLANMSVSDFLDETSSNSPVPGGGSIAALSAAFAAALTQMVANLTKGKKCYEEVQDEVELVCEKASKMKSDFVDYIDKDSDAFTSVMNAFKLPTDTTQEIQYRKSAIQETTKKAARVPLSVARQAFDMMDIIKIVVQKGNKNAASDVAVATMLARTAVLAALYNVKINLTSINDRVFVEKVTLEVNKLEKDVKIKEKEILSIIVF